MAISIATLFALVSVACAQPQPPNVVDEVCIHGSWAGPEDDWNTYSSPEVTVTEDHDFLAGPVPSELPMVQMVVEDELGTSYIDGVLYTSDWIFEHDRFTEHPVKPAPWPLPATQKPPCHVRILTDKMPTHVMVVGCSAEFVEPESGFLPDAQATLSYVCSQFGSRPCVHLSDEGFVELRPIPAQLLALPYLVVVGEWLVSTDDGGWQPGDDLGRVSASWLFRFAAD